MNTEWRETKEPENWNNSLAITSVWDAWMYWMDLPAGIFLFTFFFFFPFTLFTSFLCQSFSDCVALTKLVSNRKSNLLRQGVSELFPSLLPLSPLNLSSSVLSSATSHDTVHRSQPEATVSAQQSAYRSDDLLPFGKHHHFGLERAITPHNLRPSHANQDKENACSPSFESHEHEQSRLEIKTLSDVISELEAKYDRDHDNSDAEKRERTQTEASSSSDPSASSLTFHSTPATSDGSSLSQRLLTLFNQQEERWTKRQRLQEKQAGFENPLAQLERG